MYASHVLQRAANVCRHRLQCSVLGRTFEPTFEDPCPSIEACTEYDETQCSVLHSDGRQSQFCPVDDPPHWPTFLLVPGVDNRVGDPGRLGMLVAAGEDLASSPIAANLIRPVRREEIDAFLSRLEGELVGIKSRHPDDGRARSDAMREFLLRLGQFMAAVPSVESPFDYATRAWETRSYIVDPAMAVTARVLVVTDSCAYFNGLARARAQDSADGDDQSAAEGASGGLEGRVHPTLVTVGGVRVSCLEVSAQVPTPGRGASPEGDVDAEIFCLGQGHRCPGSDRLASPREVPAALGFRDSDERRFNLRMWRNDTNAFVEDSDIPRALRDSQPLSMAVSAWVRTHLSTATESFSARLAWQKDMPKPGSKLLIDFSSLLGPQFFLWVLTLPFPLALEDLVAEKAGVRPLMLMHGLSGTTYLLANAAFWGAVCLAYAGGLLAFGRLIGLRLFVENAASLQLLLYWLVSASSAALAMVWSAALRSRGVAIVWGYLYVFASGLVGEFLLKRLVEGGREPGPARALSIALELAVHSLGGFRGLYELASYAVFASLRGRSTGSGGMGWDTLGDPGCGMQRVLLCLAAETAGFLLLALALGWAAEGGSGRRAAPPGGPRPAGAGVDAGVALRVEGLRKEYGAAVAVDGVSFTVRAGETLSVIGPSGAGKTTALSCLVGDVRPTAGSITVAGLDMPAQRHRVYPAMGVCPQGDLLWGTLSAEEHLFFYGRLKSIPAGALPGAVADALRALNLAGVSRRPARALSGGMRRRLSVAISVIGSPAVVYMDEPSTGLDPASRRTLWEMIRGIQRSSPGTAILLTTHSMREAETLGDRVAVLAGGRLAAIAPAPELRREHGAYVTVELHTTLPDPAPVEERLRTAARPSAAAVSRSAGGTLRARVAEGPRVSVAGVLRDVMAMARDPALGITAYSVHHGSLEDVFCDIVAASP